MKAPQFVTRRLRNPWWATAVVVVAGALAARHYLAQGIPFQGDIWPHTAMAESFFATLELGEVPLWHHCFYGGFAGGSVYGPLYYLMVAGLRVLLGTDVWTATGAGLFLAHVLSGVVLFLLARRMQMDSRGAIIAAVVYTWAPWHTYQILGMGRLTFSVVYVVVPLALLGVEYAISHESVGGALLGGLCLATAPLAHAGISGSSRVCVGNLTGWFASKLL